MVPFLLLKMTVFHYFWLDNIGHIVFINHIHEH